MSVESEMEVKPFDEMASIVYTSSSKIEKELEKIQDPFEDVGTDLKSEPSSPGEPEEILPDNTGNLKFELHFEILKALNEQLKKIKMAKLSIKKLECLSIPSTSENLQVKPELNKTESASVPEAAESVSQPPLSKRSRKVVKVKEQKSSSDSSKKYFCIFCNQLTTKFTRHIETVHRNIEEVKNLSLLSSIERYEGIKRLRERCATHYNKRVGASEQILVRRVPQKICLYCSRKVVNLNRHLLVHHEEEVQVKQLKSLKGNSVEWKSKLEELARLGKTVFGQEITVRQNVPCPKCYQLFSKYSLYRHYSKCMDNPKGRNLQKNSREISIIVPTEFEETKTILAGLREGEVKDILLRDHMLLYLMKMWMEKFSGSLTAENHIRNDMRLLARLLLEAKKVNTNIEIFEHLFLPENFETFKQAAQTLGRFDPVKEIYETPSVVTNIGPLMTRCCKTMKNKYIMMKNMVMTSNLEEWKKRYHGDFSRTVGCDAKKKAHNKKCKKHV